MNRLRSRNDAKPAKPSATPAARAAMTAEELGKALLFELPPEHRSRPVLLDLEDGLVAEVLAVTWGTGLYGWYVGLELGTVRMRTLED